MNDKKSVFETLNAINVNEHTEKKGNLTYLSWAWAWQQVKKNYPLAFYTIYENTNGLNYHTDGKTAWVKTGLTIEDIEHIEYLPIMDNRNNSIMLDKITSFNVNTAIQRSLTKAAARHGLGLYIYAGEDLPSDEQEVRKVQTITDDQILTIKSLIIESGADKAKLLSWQKVSKIDDILAINYDSVITMLNKKKGQ